MFLFVGLGFLGTCMAGLVVSSSCGFYVRFMWELCKFHVGFCVLCMLLRFM